MMQFSICLKTGAMQQVNQGLADGLASVGSCTSCVSGGAIWGGDSFMFAAARTRGQGQARPWLNIFGTNNDWAAVDSNLRMVRQHGYNFVSFKIPGERRLVLDLRRPGATPIVLDVANAESGQNYPIGVHSTVSPSSGKNAYVGMQGEVPFFSTGGSTSKAIPPSIVERKDFQPFASFIRDVDKLSSAHTNYSSTSGDASLENECDWIDEALHWGAVLAACGVMLAAIVVCLAAFYIAGGTGAGAIIVLEACLSKILGMAVGCIGAIATYLYYCYDVGKKTLGKLKKPWGL